MKTYFFKNFKFSSSEELYCKSCGFKFEIEIGYKYYNIINCSNINCNFKTLKKELQLKCILPEELFNDYYNKKYSNLKEARKKMLSPYTIENWMAKGFNKDEALLKIQELKDTINLKNKNRFNVQHVMDELSINKEDAIKEIDKRKQALSNAGKKDIILKK